MNGDADDGDDVTPVGPQLYLESEAIDHSICPILFDPEETPEYRILQLTPAQQFDSLQAALEDQLEKIQDPYEAAVIMLTPNADRKMETATVGSSTTLYGLQVDPQDLTGISMAFSRILQDWNDATGPLRICLRGAESLFAYHDGELIYRFLNTVVGTLQGAGASVHMHLQPSVTDDRTLSMVKMLFDQVVEPDEPRPGEAETDEAVSPSSGGAGEPPGGASHEAVDWETVTPSMTTMSAEEIDTFLEEHGHGILAFDGDGPYAIPQSYGYDPSDRVAYFQFGLFDGSEKGTRLAASSAVSLVVMRYSRPDRWRSVIVDGDLTRLTPEEAFDRGARDAFETANLASLDVFTRDPSKVTFEWFVLEPTAFSGRKSAGPL